MEVFLSNKYTTTYYAIVNNAKSQKRSKKISYYEKHHIIPRCDPFNGDNSKDNTVLLTAKEHYICHLLLTKMCVGVAKYKMVCALNNMSRKSDGQQRYLTSIQYEKIKRLLSECKTGTKHHPETLEKFKKRIPWNKGKTKYNDERIAASALAMSGENHHRPMKGRIVSDEVRLKQSIAKTGENNPFFGKTHTIDSKSKMSIAGIGRRHTTDTKNKMSISKMGNKATSGYKWITNGIINKLIHPNEKLVEGFRYGRK